MVLEFRLPEVGENITSGTVTKIMVAVGNTVAPGQAVIEIETEKAVIEVPSNVGGKVTEIRAQVGKSIHVGDVVLVVVDGAGAPQDTPPKPALQATKESPKPATAPPGPKPAAVSAPATGPAKTALRAGRAALAAPSVRRLARELGVDINEAPGSGEGGRVSAEDVRAFAARGKEEAAPPPEEAASPDVPPADRDQWGAIERRPMTAIRRKTAMHVATAWQTIPHVTHFDSADITKVEAFRKQHGKRVEAVGGKLTITVILLKALAEALKRFPKFNASVDMENQEVLLKKYIHIGVAVDTENGLLVPVVRDVDQKTLVELSIEVARLAQKARDRKLSLEEMHGGTFTITNLGGVGGTGFTPIINFPEVAILGLARSRVEPVFGNGAFAPRVMLPLALSYDHRVIDGADAARFLRWVVEAIEQPFVLMLDKA
jgi:pyruvate dehydrogenase E2 component (dihydrolipoamide acetyltransferase)